MTTERASTTAVAIDGSARVLRTREQAIAAAHRFAAEVAVGAVARDRAGDVPAAELHALSRSGLLALRVPVEHGGPGAAATTVADVFRIIAAADPAIAQVPQNHMSIVDGLVRFGTAGQRDFFMPQVLRGARFGNAVAERGTATAREVRTRLEPTGPGTHRLNGQKYYATGALTAQWIPVLALDPTETPVIAIVPRDAAGVSVLQDWAAFGQRGTMSGTATFDDVAVPEAFVLRGFGDRGTTTSTAFSQIMQAAIDVGIARAALEDGVAFLKTRSRPWWEAEVDRAVDEPSIIMRTGFLATRVHAAEALLDRAGQTIDAVERQPDPSQTDVTEARIAVAESKAFAGEVALQVATEIIELAGSAATDAKHGLDRHWRNARTHTLHDPNRWKYHHVGNWVLREIAPAASNPTV